MLGPGRYLLGFLEILLLLGFAWLGGTVLRRRLLPRFAGAPAQLATAVVALALLIWCAELLGSFSAFDSVPYLLLVGAVGLGCWKFFPRPAAREEPHLTKQVGVRLPSLRRDQRWDWVPTLIALAIAAVAVIHFAGGVKTRLSTGMTGFDSTWYHGPFAAGFFQSGDTWSLHFIAPQFLAWFYPANGEIFHAVGMLAFSRDVLSPLLNFGWFAGCLTACWCIGRPYRVAPWSLALGAVALSVPALADQAGEARNDIVGIFFLLAAVATALNAWAEGREPPSTPATCRAAGAGEGLGRGSGGLGPYIVTGLATGLAAGAKLNFLLPVAVLVVGLAVIALPGARWRALAASGLAALAGGGYWYLRNLAQSGNPLPWIHHLGPIDLPAPQQALGGREAHSVLSYLTDGAVWSDWFLPGLHHGLWSLWPLLLLAAFAGLVLSLLSPLGRWAERLRIGQQIGPSTGSWALCVAGLAGLAGVAAWLVAPTSASGPQGMARGFESGLRYLAPALVLGLALLPASPLLRSRLAQLGRTRSELAPDSHAGSSLARLRLAPRALPAAAMLAVAAVAAIGYPVQRHYLASRYVDPTFSAPGLNAAFAWARDVSGAHIATTSTRQYPLFGTDLSNEVQFIGTEQSHGGFEAAGTCREWRRLLSEGRYDYVIATRDRLEPGKPPYPPTARWTEAPQSEVVLRRPPTVVFELHGDLSPSACR